MQSIVPSRLDGLSPRFWQEVAIMLKAVLLALLTLLGLGLSDPAQRPAKKLADPRTQLEVSYRFASAVRLKATGNPGQLPRLEYVAVDA
jgi:hypothetical protein